MEFIVPLPIEGEGSTRSDDLEPDISFVAGRGPRCVYGAMGAVLKLPPLPEIHAEQPAKHLNLRIFALARRLRENSSQ